MTKKQSKFDKNKLQVVTLKEDKPNPRLNVFNRDIRYLKSKDIRRAMSKLISEYCKGKVINEDAKTLTHMFSVYIQILNATEMEDRISKLESELS